jgi:hypothetical protein
MAAIKMIRCRASPATIQAPRVMRSNSSVIELGLNNPSAATCLIAMGAKLTNPKSRKREPPQNRGCATLRVRSGVVTS